MKIFYDDTERKFFVVLLILCILLLLATAINVHADSHIKVINKSNQKVTYMVYWIDHDWPNWPFPATIMGGELLFNEEHQSCYSYRPGSYFIQWDPGLRLFFDIMENDDLITIENKRILKRKRI